MEIFAYILALIWSILCLILFFKILGMTNNVEQLAQEVHELKWFLCKNKLRQRSSCQRNKRKYHLFKVLLIFLVMTYTLEIK